VLKRAMPLYEILKHPYLIELIKHFELDDLYVVVFKWADGDCLFDHWNFEKYSNNPDIIPPYLKFKQLPIDKKLKMLDVVFSFFEVVAKEKYIAIDFYDGSIMFDFSNDTTTICDIDFFEKTSYINTMGRMWGSSRFMSPEENQKGANIDEITNVFTLGAMMFYVLGDARDHSFEKWQADKELFDMALKATNPDRYARHQSIRDFLLDWSKIRQN
jgi:serine/threonine-protein kinase